MPDFSSLLKRPAGQAPKPKPLAYGNYAGIIKGHSLEAAPEGKEYTQIVRFQLGLLDWPEGMAEEDRVQDNGDGTTRPIALDKRQLRRDFYDNGLHRLDDFIKSCGIDMTGKTYEEVLPELTGTHVTIEVQQYLNQRTGDLGNQVGNLTGGK